MARPPGAPDPEPSHPHPGTLTRLFLTIPHGIFLGVLTSDESRTEFVNPALKVLLGFDPETGDAEIRPFDRTSFADRDAHDALLDRLRRDGAVTDYLVRLRRVDGAWIWVEITARTEPTPETGALSVHALVRDVSDRRKLELHARELQHELVQTEKMAVLGQTISGVAHELNNPLATILANAERLALVATSSQIRQGVATILGEAERAARIVRNLLTFARRRHTTRTTVDVNDVVRATLALRQYEQRVSNISVIDALAVGLPRVFGDPHQLQQVVLNLVVNAEQAMLAAHGRGTLLVRSWHEPDRGLIILEVHDDGPGITAAAMPRVFDPFFTTKEVGEGTGLGLTVAYAIVQEHGGRLELDPAPGQGAAFRVELPITGREEVRRPVEPAPSPDDVGQGAVVLVVEDEEALAAVMAETLQEAGFVVERAADGQEALDRVEQGPVDLIVCDLKMPKVDGQAFYRAIAARAPVLARRVIFATGDVVGAEAEAFLRECGCPWLAKPFRLAELLRVCREALG